MMTCPSSIRRAASLGVAALLILPQAASAQVVVAGGFAPGARTIVDLNFAGTPVGEFPKGLRLLQGNLEVVDKGGVRMLRASSPSEFVLQLPEALPKDFTLEFELIPKACCNPVDLAVEGVISGSRSSVSAQLEWDADHFAVVGGNPQMFQMDMPASIAATLPSTLTKVAISIEDETVKMYTNGRRLYTLAERKFVRGRVLRIWLGGQDEDKYAVYLARARVADLAPAIITSNAPQAGPRSVTGNSATGTTASTAPGPVTGVMAGPIPAGTIAPTPAQTAATQPTLSSPANPPPAVSTSGTTTQTSAGAAGTSGTTSGVTRPPGTTSGPLTIMSDGPAPNLVALPIAGGLKLSYNPISGTSRYQFCRESPPGSTCVPVNIGSGEEAEPDGSRVYRYDLGLVPGGTYVYRLTAFRADGHYGQSAPATGMAGPLGAPMNLRVSGFNSSPAQVVLQWDPVQYQDFNGTQALQTYQVSGTGVATPTVVSATQIAIPIDPAKDTYAWTVTPVLPNATVGWQPYGSATFDYTLRYRLVALGVKAVNKSQDDILDFDGKGDEVYVVAVVNTTNRGLTAHNFATARSATYGDVGTANAFPGRVQGGTTSTTGGIRTGDLLPISLNFSNPTGNANIQGFPLRLWEGNLDDNAMVVVHPSLFEEDNDRKLQGKFVTAVNDDYSPNATGHRGLSSLITTLRDQDAIGPAHGTNPFLWITGVNGEDRPVGVRRSGTGGHNLSHRVLVLTRSAVERALMGPGQVAGGPPGLVAVQLFDDGYAGATAMYELYLRIERVP